jgi:hypothetical protein
MVFWLFLLSLMLLIANIHESFTDTEFKNVKRPDKSDSAWQSKVAAHSDFKSDKDAMTIAAQSFYDKVYKPSPTKPTHDQMVAFVKTTSLTEQDKTNLIALLTDAFHAEASQTAAAKEQGQIKFQASAAIQPKDARDEVYTREEKDYYPEVPGFSREFSEGPYQPSVQQPEPRRPGVFNDNSTSWTPNAFASVCECGSSDPNCLCAKSVL